MLFMEYHKKYPSHGYRWLNAKIRLDTGIVHSDPYAYKCCRAAGIKSRTKHYRYKKPGNPYRLFPNLLLAGLPAYAPMQYIASDMTAFCFKGTYYELTLYMDLTRRQDDIHKRFRRTDKNQRKRNGMADDTAFRPGRGICVQEIQRHTSASPHRTFNVQSGDSDGQRCDGSDKRLAEIGTVYRLSRNWQRKHRTGNRRRRRNSIGRRIAETVILRGRSEVKRYTPIVQD